MSQNCPVSCNTCESRTTTQDGQATTGRPATEPVDDIITTVLASTTGAPPTLPMTEAVTQNVEQQTKVVTEEEGSGAVDGLTTSKPAVSVCIACL